MECSGFYSNQYVILATMFSQCHCKVYSYWLYAVTNFIQQTDVTGACLIKANRAVTSLCLRLLQVVVCMVFLCWGQDWSICVQQFHYNTIRPTKSWLHCVLASTSIFSRILCIVLWIQQWYFRIIKSSSYIYIYIYIWICQIQRGQ